ncbi:MAG: hypothetical protein ACK55A_00985, partial [Gemmatimonas sp.]
GNTEASHHCSHGGRATSLSIADLRRGHPHEIGAAPFRLVFHETPAPATTFADETSVMASAR